jgi:hypothetical protein
VTAVVASSPTVSTTALDVVAAEPRVVVDELAAVSAHGRLKSLVGRFSALNHGLTPWLLIDRGLEGKLLERR